ncbi:MAG: hypothetical protein A2381_16030 [Bdellovibrionales bacterium RIFOXYB1_FULL_37_110]|nr:MAG: hypothetical protein A2417_07880 [Bdellovibrionales bacterium RIFOXYC1_FULL_37_79]OFZ57122.1 MAG: hypothetical protein A2381_16030 [Bdellovibrionales bacterium RIFOXYB1_FULL_37_110]OFZ65394.1 MAG: hypothetical protein A2577_03840 [Bdellovibrionales bacterium RIFOXYD1_FULL_36_51]
MNVIDSNKKKLIQKTGLDKYYKALSWADYNKQMFDKLAPKYDAGNVLHSFGTKWKYDRLAMEKIVFPAKPSILDLCTGSGDIAIYLAEKYPASKVVALDASLEMIKLAKKKACHLHNIEFIEGDALALPFDNETFDVVIISYGLRNLTSIEEGIQEMIRVTKKNGFVSSIDQGKPHNPLFNFIYKIYFYNIAPLIGKMVFHWGEYNTFRYLPESNKYFPHPNDLMLLFSKHGLKNVKNFDYLVGAIAQQLGQKI